MAEVILRQLAKTFGKVKAVDGVTLRIPDGEFLVLLGPSGCGKSSVLRLIAGLEDVTAGEIEVGGRLLNFVDPTKRNVAMVFQNYALYPHMTVFKNVAFPLETARVRRSEVERAVQGAAEMLKITELLDRLPSQLSGGQRQRVALARAIVREPAVFLMDEPLSNLDAQLRLQTRLELMALHERLGITTLYVTHDQVEAMTMGHRIALMRDGRLQQVGSSSEVYATPVNTFVAEFLGAPPMNLLDGEIISKGGNWYFRRTDYELRIVPSSMGFSQESLNNSVGKAVIGLRPEKLRLSSVEGTGIPGTIRFLEPLGSDLFTSVEVEGGTVQVRLAPETKVHVGDNVRIGFDPQDLHLFDSQEQNIRRPI